MQLSNQVFLRFFAALAAPCAQAGPCDPASQNTLAFRDVFTGIESQLSENFHSWGERGLSPHSRWRVEGNILKRKGYGKFEELVLNGAYRDFVLSFEWAVTPGANGGVKYNVDEASGKAVGLEYQILDDDRHPDARLGIGGNRMAGALYDVLGAQFPRVLRPVGEFNAGCLSFVAGMGEHWLGGRLVLAYDTADPRIHAKVAQSKFKAVDGFLRARAGQVFLQDHGDELWFRNIRISQAR